MNICSYIDHTFLKPTALYADIQKLCTEAINYSFAAVCVPPPMVTYARDLVKSSHVKVATVIGFPFGYSVKQAKSAETQQAIVDQADELDVVINLIALENGQWDYLESEMSEIVCVAHDQGKIVKAIIETGLLSEEQIIRCCHIYPGCGVDFLKTSTGYAQKSATVDAVRLMRRNLPASILVKASGGIKTYDFAKELVDAGASRLGCSASVAIAAGEQRIEASGY